MPRSFKTCLLRALCAAILGLSISFVGLNGARAQDVYGASGQDIRQIRITGTQRIEPSTVMNYLDVKVGDKMTQDTLDRALKSLFATGLFSDVVLRQKDGDLEVHVTENPVINEIAFEGNKKIEDDQLRGEIQLKPRQVFTRAKVQADVNRLYQLYQRQGRFSVKIDPKIINLDQNRVNLVFEINEGDVTKVESIRFVGNTHYADDKLRSILATKEKRWYRFLTTDDRYDPDRLAYDQELLRKFYLSQGYADFRVISANAELSRRRDQFYITITIEEGERYHTGKVAINSQLKNFDATVLNQYITFKTGEWYDADKVEKTVDKMTTALGDMQYAFVAIRPDVQRNPTTHTVDITFDISETPRVYVERIDIHGNVRTQDKVIRRQLTLVEGDPFNKTKLAKSEQNIKDLGYFEKVTVTPQQGSAPDKTVVDVNVTEQSTGELSLGAGFSTEDGPLADVRLREKNFLGKGQDVSISSTIAGKRSDIDFSFTEPYFLDRDLSAGFDLFHMTHDLEDESSYDQRETGAGLNLGYPLSDRWRQTLRYRIENNEIYNVQSDASTYILDQQGTWITSAIGQRLTYDTRDSTLFPTSGFYGWLDTEISGFGGDSHYIQGKLGGSYFYPIADQWVANLLAEGGAMTGYDGVNVRIDERFFLGGDSFRGFEVSGIGPRERDGEEDALGGDYFYRGTAELTFPLGLPQELGVAGHAFNDFGSLFGLDNASGADAVDQGSLRAAAGLGVSWRSPLGPIRIDLAYPYLRQSYDKIQVFRFSFGTRF
jgi:outer membrane protein insertion porin family